MSNRDDLVLANAIYMYALYERHCPSKCVMGMSNCDEIVPTNVLYVCLIGTKLSLQMC